MPDAVMHTEEEKRLNMVEIKFLANILEMIMFNENYFKVHLCFQVHICVIRSAGRNLQGYIQKASGLIACQGTYLDRCIPKMLVGNSNCFFLTSLLMMEQLL